MAAGRCRPVLDVTERPLAPILARDLVALAAVEQEFARETPVSIALQPGFQAVGVCLLPKAAHIVVGHAVRHQAAEVPQEALTLVHRAHDFALQDRKIRDRVVSVGILEDLRHVVGPVLATGLVAVLHDHLPGFAVLRRNAAEKFTHEGVVMPGNVLAAHLVHLQACPFRDGRRIFDAGRFHIAHEHRPLPVGHLPAQFPVLHLVGQVHQEHRIHVIPEIDILRRVPHIGIPQRKRFLEHLGEGFLRIAGHIGLLRERDGERAVGRVLQPDLIGAGRGFHQVLHPRRQRLESHVQAHVVPIVIERRQLLPVQGKPDRRPLLPVALQDERAHGERHRHLQRRRNAFTGFQGPGAGSALHRPPGLDRDDAVGRHVRKRDDLLASVPDNLLILSRDIFHTLLRGDPRPAGLAPARAVEHADFDVQFPSPLHRRVGDVPPLVGKELHGTVGITLGLVADERPRDAHALHRLQVLDDALLGDVIVQPIPVHSRPDGIRRRLESGFQGLPGVMAGAAKRQRGTKDQQLFHHW